MLAGTGLPPHILNGSPSIENTTGNIRVSTGGTSRLDTIKAFVEKANRTQMEQLQSSQLEMQTCTIEQAEYQAHGPPFKKPLYDVLVN